MSDALRLLHDEVDRAAAALAQVHRDRLNCRRGCHDCCVDDLTVFEVEAERIREHHAELLATGAPHRAGACAFLDGDGACRIYEDRPYVCRTQGLPLRWIEHGDDGEPVEYRDICPLNEEGPPIETLGPEDCWSIGPFEARLGALQEERSGDTPRRIALRDLFRLAS
jgi:hypothetical protein